MTAWTSHIQRSKVGESQSGCHSLGTALTRDAANADIARSVANKPIMAKLRPKIEDAIAFTPRANVMSPASVEAGASNDIQNSIAAHTMATTIQTVAFALLVEASTALSAVPPSLSPVDSLLPETYALIQKLAAQTRYFNAE